ncbi:penicillin-binding transpeptidase domain-containing protein [Pseudoduganella sp. OTU4001]|uniref:penicillin-binding transpeptidase domain-containing protein n=1 Tax=Pseudoduganella sp. OTU4001 TaxID=3043854 RepID=UPI00313C9C02
METILARLSAWRRDRRRQRNLRSGAATPVAAPAALALAAAALAVAALGAYVLWRHAGRLGEEGSASPAYPLAALQALMPGQELVVQEAPGAVVQTVAGGSVLVASGLQAGPVARVDLCTRPLPLHLGYRFSEVAGEPALRRALLVGEESKVPAMTIGAGTDGLRVRWRERGEAAQWTADAPGAALDTLGWLTWRGGALRVERRHGKRCAQGEIVVQSFSASERAERAYVTLFPAGGAPSALRLAPGRYPVPQQAIAPREDEVLFKRLLARGLLRRGGDGLLELALPDLAQWLAAGQDARALALPGWQEQQPDEEMRRLLKRLYRQADGEYVRRQVDLFNSERRLLAWRLGSGAPQGATVALLAPGGGELAQTGDMPPLAVRLFADLPQGWQAWSRAAHWDGRGAAVLVVHLPQAARGNERIDLLLAGRLAGAADAAQGGPVAAVAACSGPACRTASDVQALSLRPRAGATRIVLPVQALDVSGAQHPGDQAYRHIRLAHGEPAWQPIAPALYSAYRAGGARGQARAATGGTGTMIADRDGMPLWSGGVATPSARDAGLTTLLGAGPGHDNSLSGMLARAAVAGQGGEGAARLTISLPLQALGQAILECQGLRGGEWDGKRCVGGTAPPAQRRAGLVLLDAGNGDILLAAGAGGPQATSANWREAREFDRANPARSALRLPAWQHDGGAHHSPGSAFKIISALGLELAARHDRVLDGLLGGQPLADIDRLAQQRGYAFRTDAAIYPNAAQAAHVTNYREQSLVRRAESGRLGLAQAMTYSVNTWFAWTAELSDRTLQGQADGGAPGLRALEAGALAAQRPIAEAARLLGFDAAMRLDGGLLPQEFRWQAYDALQSSASRIDPIDSRHELRQMAIGLRMQATPLQMAVAAAAIGAGKRPAPRLLLSLGGREAEAVEGAPLAMRLDRIRQGMKGVVDSGTAASAFAGPALDAARRGLYGKTGTAPVSEDDATVWFTGWLEPGSLPGQTRRLAFAAFISHSQLTGGGHAAPIVASLLKAMAGQNAEQKGNSPSFAANGWASTMPR